MEIAAMYSMFFWIAIPATIIFIIMILASLIGAGDAEIDGDMDFDTDIDTDTDTESGGDFPIFTIKNLFAFLTMFSWTGMACVKYGLGTAATLGISTGAGVVLVLILSSIYVLMSKLKHENVPSIKTTVGQTAKVYLRIPKNGRGQVSVIVNGSLQTIDAITKNGKTFNTGDTVEVVEATDTELIVDSVK